MKLHDIFNDPLLLAEAKSRACGNAGMALGPPVIVRPVKDKWPNKQARNTEPATRAREDNAQGKGEAK